MGLLKKEVVVIRAWICFTVIFLPFFASNLSANNDSGVARPSYGQIESELTDLETEYPDWAKKVVYGASTNGQKLSLIRISKALADSLPTTQEGKAVYISGATHGNEYLNIEDRLPRYFLENRKILPSFNQFLNEGGVLYILPILNPDGFTAGTRQNAHQTDLNRDFPILLKAHPGFYEPESRMLVDYLIKDLAEHNLKLALTWDYHCCGAALIHPWSFDADPIAKPDLKAHQEIGKIMQSLFSTIYRVGASVEILKKPRTGTSKDYFYETFHSLSFTFEGKKNIENSNFPKHTRLWEKIFHVLNHPKTGS